MLILEELDNARLLCVRRSLGRPGRGPGFLQGGNTYKLLCSLNSCSDHFAGVSVGGSVLGARLLIETCIVKMSISIYS